MPKPTPNSNFESISLFFFLQKKVNIEDDRLALLEHRLGRLKTKLEKQQQQVLQIVNIQSKVFPFRDHGNDKVESMFLMLNFFFFFLLL